VSDLSAAGPPAWRRRFDHHVARRQAGRVDRNLVRWVTSSFDSPCAVTESSSSPNLIWTVPGLRARAPPIPLDGELQSSSSDLGARPSGIDVTSFVAPPKHQAGQSIHPLHQFAIGGRASTEFRGTPPVERRQDPSAPRESCQVQAFHLPQRHGPITLRAKMQALASAHQRWPTENNGLACRYHGAVSLARS